MKFGLPKIWKRIPQRAKDCPIIEFQIISKNAIKSRKVYEKKVDEINFSMQKYSPAKVNNITKKNN